MTAAERIESKRRRDREYRQRKRGLDFEASELQTEKKMGRRSKYATEEERLESKRLRDSRYRSRQKAKHQVAEEGVCQVEVENGFENVENYWNEDAQANENFGVTNESSGRGKKVTSLTEVLQCQKIVERRPSRRWSTEESILVRKNAGWRNGDATPNTERECG